MKTEMMKSTLKMMAVAALFFAATALTACGGSNETNNAETSGQDAHAAHYQCPMDCEEGKTYEEAGTCPVCKMDLEKVEG